jgi:hypothetical protein
MSDSRQFVHEMIDELDAGQLAAVEHLLEVMIHDDEEELTEGDRRAVAASREYFQRGGVGIPFEQVVAECGFTMEEIRGSKSDLTSPREENPV